MGSKSEIFSRFWCLYTSANRQLFQKIFDNFKNAEIKQKSLTNVVLTNQKLFSLSLPLNPTSKKIISIVSIHKSGIVHYLMYLSINFLWKSGCKESLIKVFSFLSGSAREQFLNTTSSSHLRLTFMSDLSEFMGSEYFSRNKGFPLRDRP